jgi:hypothetical protein
MPGLARQQAAGWAARISLHVIYRESAVTHTRFIKELISLNNREAGGLEG